MSDKKTLVELKNVQKAYREPNGDLLPILDIEHLAISPGDQIVIRGRSGCGKTTLLHAIAGLTPIDSGSIMFAGVRFHELAEAGRDRFRAHHIGYVFQTFNLLPAFTALENVMLGMTFTGRPKDRSRAIALLEEVGLGHRMHHKPSSMSVGEQQRTAVARALVNKPKLLLADEPTANIDPGHQQQVVDMLREVCVQEQVAMLMVTHSPEVSDQFDHVIALEELNRVVRAA
ncbi:ABC transporter ATP-binding protein [Aeoliella mucimassa]|uniref:Lipoprotein-releasing system ATP-binding protein LolD n=1 Tax=Aeoliella mucimassa TaxID=2527972 RepID=A0A518AWE0_9BACT|nr:ABC transporter ATP-binding protein [Aeoliella mucimassa]QDU59042.1 Lipoprotein-releasing system ATP-binding protein LolD [Aeoliella mucimassa]